MKKQTSASSLSKRLLRAVQGGNPEPSPWLPILNPQPSPWGQKEINPPPVPW
jgi:hypothetical protein